MEIEFTTFEGQTSFTVGHLTGHDGVAYFWDFNLYENDDPDKTYLIFNENFYG